MVDSPSTNELQKARNAAFQFLKTRNRSEKEIRDRLARKKFSKEIIDETALYLKNLNLIDDRQFAKSWIGMRLNKPFGVRRIFIELTAKGISKEILKEAFEALPEGYQEQRQIEELARKRISRYAALDPIKRKRRLFEFLVRRGFSPDAVLKVIETL